MSEYENKIILITQEIERLNGSIKTKNDEINRYENNTRSLNQELESYKRKVTDYEYSISQINQ